MSGRVGVQRRNPMSCESDYTIADSTSDMAQQMHEFKKFS
jgi:hypothetical protein